MSRISRTYRIGWILLLVVIKRKAWKRGEPGVSKWMWIMMWNVQSQAFKDFHTTYLILINMLTSKQISIPTASHPTMKYYDKYLVHQSKITVCCAFCQIKSSSWWSINRKSVAWFTRNCELRDILGILNCWSKRYMTFVYFIKNFPFT